MPSMHQMQEQAQEMTSEEKWNAYEARRVARRQLRRRGVTAAPSIPKPDLADITVASEAPEKDMTSQTSHPTCIDLSSVAAAEEEPYQPATEAGSTAMVDDIPEWIVKRHLERRFGAIEVEAPTRGDAFVPDKAPELEKTLINSEKPEWAVNRRLTRRPGIIEVEAPIGRDAFMPEETSRTGDTPYLNNMAIVSDEPERVAEGRLTPTRRSSTIEDEAPIGRNAFVPERTLESEWTTRGWATIAYAPRTPTIEPGDERNSPGSPEWTTVSYKKTTGHRTSPINRRHKHEMTRSRDEPEKNRSGRPRWRGIPEPEISPRAPGIDTGGDQKTRESDEKPISRSPCKGDAREFAERSRMLLQQLKNNPEFAALPRSEQRSLLAELMEDDAEENDPPATAMTQPEGDHNETLALLEEDDRWQENDNLQGNDTLFPKANNDWCSPSCWKTKKSVNTSSPSQEKKAVITQKNGIFILPEESIHPEGTDEQQWLPELGRDDWTDEPEDDANPGTADYWIQLIRNLTKEESNEFLDDLLERTTDGLPNDGFNDSAWDEAAIQLPNSGFTQEEVIDLIQNNSEGARPANDSRNVLSPQVPTSTRNNISPVHLTTSSVTPSQGQPTESTITTEELKPLNDLQQGGVNSEEQQMIRAAEYEARRRQRRRAAKTTSWDTVEYQWNIEATGRTVAPIIRETEPTTITITSVPETAENNPGRDQNDHQEVPQGCSNPEATDTNALGRERTLWATEAVKNDHASPRHTTKAENPIPEIN
ncbi:hypothetical protein H4582DRAFT_2060446 [Lactarius indigo]|nr:hypothetical protein H4582DRAFT_2060446 [Lactarius indigo]